MRIAEFAEGELGLKLTPAQSAMLTEFEQGGYSEAVWCAGRRFGKSLLSDVLVLFDAVCRDDLRQYLRPNELRISGLICPRIDQAADHLANCRNLIDNSPRLKRMLISATSDELLFSNGSAVRAYPCSARAARGGAWSSAVLDELAHFIDADGSNAAAERVYEAVKPALAQFGDGAGWLVSISTPRWKQGQFYELVTQAQSGRYPEMHYVHRPTHDNPLISRKFLEREQAKDPELYAREYLAEFVDGVSSYLSSEDVLRSVRQGVNVLPPRRGVAYAGAIDPGGRVDNFGLCIAHREGARVIVDGCWSWRRQPYDVILNGIRDVALNYGVRTLISDQSSIEAIKILLQQRGLSTDHKPWSAASKVSAFGALKLALNAGQVELPDHPQLIEELLNLESRPTATEYERINAARGHDDLAFSLTAVTYALLPKLIDDIVMISGAGYTYGDRQWSAADADPLFGNQGWHGLFDD